MAKEMLNISIELIKSVVKKAIEEKMKNNSTNNNRQSNSSATASRSFRMFKPKFSLKEKQEAQQRQRTKEYQRNNRVEHKLGSSIRPGELTGEAQKVRNNYRQTNQELREFNEYRISRGHAKK